MWTIEVAVGRALAFNGPRICPLSSFQNTFSCRHSRDGLRYGILWLIWPWHGPSQQSVEKSGLGPGSTPLFSPEHLPLV